MEGDAGLKVLDPADVAILKANSAIRIESVGDTFGAPVLVPAFQGQQHSKLHTQLGAHPQTRPDVSTFYVTYEDAYFIVGGGQDGVIFTSDGAPISQTCLFAAPPFPTPDELRSAAVDLPADVFVGFDCAWRNYYHWICLFLSKALMAKEMGARPQVVLPDYDERTSPGWKVGFSRETYQQSLYLSGLVDGLLPLKSGIYRARRVHTVLVNHWQPAFLSLSNSFDFAFDSIRRRLRRDDTLPRRVYIKRSANPRIPESLIEPLERKLAQMGFVAVSPENLDFIRQAELFLNAEAVAAAHGAALTNLLFGAKSLSVLELNGQIGGEPHLRPWFYLLAMGRGQRYCYLDTTEPKFVSSDMLGDALRTATSRFPTCRPG